MTQKYWENRYQTQDMPWEKGEASQGLVDFLAENPEIRRGKICVPGCGTGHDVRVWAQAGFDAFGFDIAPSAIQLANEKTQAAGIRLGSGADKTTASRQSIARGKMRPVAGMAMPLGSASFQLANFLQDQPPFKFDWLFEHTLFCAIDPSERDHYGQAVLRWLKPRSQFLAVHYLIPDTDGPPFGTTRDELWQRYSPHFELLKEWVPRSYPNRTGLELMLWWRRR